MNRFLYCLLFFVFISLSASAQRNRSNLIDAFILKGTYLIGGDFSTSFKGFSSDRGSQKNLDKGSIFRVNVNAKTGYFPLQDFVIGLNTRLDHFNTNGDSTNAGPEETNIILGPFARYYFKTGVFVEGGIGFGLYNITEGQQSDLFEGSGGLGYTYFLNDKIAIEPVLLYRYSKQKFAGGVSGGNDNSLYGPEFRLGIQAYLFRNRQVLPKP